MVEQLYWGMESAGQKPSNVVFMGMGEPLHNLEAVARALRIFEHPWGAGLSPRRLTVSTAGVVPGIDALAKLRPAPNLAISLNATTDEVRDRIMPVNRHWNIARAAGRRSTLPAGPPPLHHFRNTSCLPASTDSDMDAARLPRLLRGIRAR